MIPALFVWGRRQELDAWGNPCLQYFGVKWLFIPVIMISMPIVLINAYQEHPPYRSSSIFVAWLWVVLCALVLYVFRPQRYTLQHSGIEITKLWRQTLLIPIGDIQMVQRKGRIMKLVLPNKIITILPYLSGQDYFVEQLEQRGVKVSANAA